MTSAAELASKLSGHAQKYAAARANQGHGGLGKWPGTEQEDWHGQAWLTAVEIAQDVEIKYKNEKGGPLLMTQGFKFQPVYARADEDGDGEEFRGIPLRIPYDVSIIPDDGEGGSRFVLRKDFEVLKGHLTGITGSEYDDLGAHLAAAEKVVTAASADGGNGLLVDLDIRWRDWTDAKGNVKWQRNDHIQAVAEEPVTA